MSKLWSYIRQLVGNGKTATIGIFLFIVLLIFMFHKAHAADVEAGAGTSFGTEGTGPVLSLSLGTQIQPGLNARAGTDLWGSTTHNNQIVPNNWDWHAELEGCKGPVCAGIGPAYVQRVDAINGAHTNFYLGIRWQIAPRVALTLGHISDAGTSSPNVGRQAFTIVYRLQ